MNRHYTIAFFAAVILIGLPFAYANLTIITPVHGLSPTPHCEHGWPLTYLKRQVAETDSLVIHVVQYRWPIPAMPNETREFNMQSLFLNIAFAFMAITLATMLGAKLMNRSSRNRSSIET